MFERICWVSCTCKTENVQLLFSWWSQNPNSYPTCLIAVQISMWLSLSVLHIFYFIFSLFGAFLCYKEIKLWQLSSAHAAQISTHPRPWLFSIKEKMTYTLANIHWAYIIFEAFQAWKYSAGSDSTSNMPLLRSILQVLCCYIPAYTIQPPPLW